MHRVQNTTYLVTVPSASCHDHAIGKSWEVAENRIRWLIWQPVLVHDQREQLMTKPQQIILIDPDMVLSAALHEQLVAAGQRPFPGVE